MNEVVSVVIALGSNLGNRWQYIHSGIESLQTRAARGVMLKSSVYRSPAMTQSTTERQRDYYNAVVEFETVLPADQLLQTCLAIEKDNGRTRSPGARWQSRTLDMDVICYGDQAINMPRLTVPHPGLADRRFVLEPLAEIAPLRHIPSPFNGTVQYLLDQCPDQTILRRFSFDRITTPT